MSEQKDKTTMEEKFYSKEFYFSYSGLNKLLYSPRLFYKHYILEEREEKTDAHLIEGKLVHALLLDEANFNKNFILLPGNLPTGNTRLVVDQVFSMVSDGSSLRDNPDVILVKLQDINLHQSLKTDDQRLAKIISEDTEAYWEFLKNKEGKDIIDQQMLDKCKEDVNMLKSNEKIVNLLKLNNKDDKIKVYNELPIMTEIDKTDNMPFGFKGILDNLVVDDKNKYIYINDIKTTSKTIAEFPETVDYYNYWIQAALYLRLANAYVKRKYKCVFHFIVIDKYQQVYCFNVSPETLGKWTEKLDELLIEAKWHYENRIYDLPYKFANETVTL